MKKAPENEVAYLIGNAYMTFTFKTLSYGHGGIWFWRTNTDRRFIPTDKIAYVHRYDGGDNEAQGS